MSFQDFFEDSPFYNLRISSHELLHLKRKKEKCPKCQRLSLYYCYSCVERMPTYIDKIPTITLPLQTYIWVHPKETDSKSTGLHAKILAPSSVQLITFDPVQDPFAFSTVFPSADFFEKTLILYPSEDATKYLDEIPESSYDSVFVIEGTWRQSMTMIQSLENYYYNIQEPMGKLFSSNLEATTTNLNYVQPMKPSLTHHLKRLRKVKLRESKVQGHFWRYQPYGEHCLATIEAIYYFFRQFIELYPTQALSTSPTIDDLLYFYSYFYHRIQENYRQNNSKTFTSKHVKNYIKY